MCNVPECMPYCSIKCLQVILYRSGLVTAAASFVLAAASAFIPEGNVVGDIIRQDINFLYSIGAGGLGLSLLLIHIYVTPIKRFLQLLWMLGVFGSLGAYLTLARPLNESLIDYVIDNPTSVWFIGPLFAALTGLVFKEGINASHSIIEVALLLSAMVSILYIFLDLNSIWPYVLLTSCSSDM